MGGLLVTFSTARRGLDGLRVVYPPTGSTAYVMDISTLLTLLLIIFIHQNMVDNKKHIDTIN